MRLLHGLDAVLRRRRQLFHPFVLSGSVVISRCFVLLLFCFLLLLSLFPFFLLSFSDKAVLIFFLVILCFFLVFLATSRWTSSRLAAFSVLLLS